MPILEGKRMSVMLSPKKPSNGSVKKKRKARTINQSQKNRPVASKKNKTVELGKISLVSEVYKRSIIN